MSYSLHPPRRSADRSSAEPTKKASPRVILHPNGRPSADATAGKPNAGGRKYGANSGGSQKGSSATATATIAANREVQGNGSKQSAAAGVFSGNSPASHSISPPGAAAALHVMQDSNNPNAFLSAQRMGPHRDNAEVLLKKTEEQMAALERKLSAMHADILRLNPSTPAPKKSTAASPSSTQAHGAANPSTRSSARSSASSNGTAVTAAPANGPRGGVHHLSPIKHPVESASSPPKTAAKSTLPPAMAGVPKPAAPAAASAPDPRAPGLDPKQGGEQSLTLDGHKLLDSPGGSSSDDDSSSSSSSDRGGSATASDGKKKAAGESSATAKAGAPCSGGAAPPRQGFGFKNPGKPTGPAPDKPKGRGIHMATTEEEAPKEKAEEKRLSSDGGIMQADSTVASLGASGKRTSVEGAEARRGKLFSLSEADAPVGGSPKTAQRDGATRRLPLASKTLREQFFAAVPRQEEILGDRVNSHAALASIRLPGTPCSWLCCISVALSFVTGVPTTVEKVLKTNHLGVHYLSLQAITLAQLYDMTNDYIHTRFHRNSTSSVNCAEDEFDEDEEAAQHLTAEELGLLPHVHCEMATMDSEVIDPVEESEASYGMGEHAPVTSLAQFRKELIARVSDERSLFILNYDPYIIEERETRLRANNAESEEEEEAIWRGMLYKKGDNRGAFGILLSFNSAQHTATIVSPHMTKDSYPLRERTNLSEVDKKKLERLDCTLNGIVLEEHTVPLQTLYEALKQRDTYTQLCRGFVRVFVSETFSPKVPSVFPLFVLDGSSAGGLMTTTLDVSIAPHVLGLAMMHHLSITFLLSDNARRKQSSRNLLSKANVCDVKLRGIPLTKIIQQLRLPISMFVGQSNKESIAMAFSWYTVFLQQLQVSSDVRVGLVRPERRGGADDGQPNIDEEEFLAHLRTVISTQSVMLISFDINVALNVRINPSSEPAHFAIVIGLDEGRGIIRLADVNVKRFRKTWHIPFYRLYNAVMGYGYIVAAKDKKTIKSLNGKSVQEEVLRCGRYALPPVLRTNESVRFEYPLKPYALTVLADAVSRMGFRSDVERFLNYSGFHISYFLSRHLPLESAAFVTQNYSHYALDDAISVVTKHYDYTANSSPPAAAGSKADDSKPSSPNSAPDTAFDRRTEAELLADVEYALASPSTRQLVVKLDPSVIASDTVVFNGSKNGGCYAIVMDYDSATKSVYLSNGDPLSFYRVFSVPFSLLFQAVSVWDEEDMRACGTVLLTSDRSQEDVYDNTKGYDFAHALVHHPFRPVFSAACSCFSLAATELMLNIESPTMLGGAPLAVEDEEKKKYKRYNNIFSAEDILYAMPKFSVRSWQSAVSQANSEDAVAMANAAFKQLRLPIVAVDITHTTENVFTDPITFLHACNGVSGLLTITLLAYNTDKMYGVPGFSMGVVNRVRIFEEEDDEDTAKARRRSRFSETSKGSVQLLEGEPCRWGAVCERSAEELMQCVVYILCVMEVVDEAEEDAG